MAQIVYTALGDPSLAKERIEVLGEAGAASSTTSARCGCTAAARRARGRKRDKGHAAELGAFLRPVRTGEQPWPVADMAAVMRGTFAIRDAHRQTPRLPVPG